MTEDRYDFECVRDREYEAIKEAREEAREDISGFGTGKDDLFGLAFSGGGIRSATFNLGVLQGLSRAGLLKQIDYLSTVSGGGYIGSWLSAWIWREGGNVAAVEQALGNPPGQKGLEPRPVGWLRRYSNYLTAKVGLFSADTLERIFNSVRKEPPDLRNNEDWLARFFTFLGGFRCRRILSSSRTGRARKGAKGII